MYSRNWKGRKQRLIHEQDGPFHVPDWDLPAAGGRLCFPSPQENPKSGRMESFPTFLEETGT